MVVISTSDTRVVGVIVAVCIDISRPVHGGVLDVHLFDWKCSLDPSSCLVEYTKQLNMYKYILESNYIHTPFTVYGDTFTDISVKSMTLVSFHEGHDDCREYAIDDCAMNNVCITMNERKRNLSS